MNHCKNKIRPVAKIPGGKAYLARRILAETPDDNVAELVEVFGGMGSWILNAEPSGATLKMWNDINPGTWSLFHILKHALPVFLDKVQQLDYDNATFLRYRDATPPPGDLLSWALKTLVVHCYSRGGMGQTFAWSERQRGGRPGDLNAWETRKTHLVEIAQRVRGLAKIACKDFREVISRHDSPTTVQYWDPPYLHTTRVSRKLYQYEMSEKDHADLLELARTAKSRILISHYDCPLYREGLPGWRVVQFDMPCHQSQQKTKARRQELLFCNF